MAAKIVLILVLSVLAYQAVDCSTLLRAKQSLRLRKPSLHHAKHVLDLGRFKFAYKPTYSIVGNKFKSVTSSAALDQLLEDIQALNVTMIEDSNKIVKIARDAYNNFDQQLVDISQAASQNLNVKSDLLVSHAKATVGEGLNLGLPVDDCINGVADSIKSLTNKIISEMIDYNYDSLYEGEQLLNEVTAALLETSLISEFETVYQQCLNLEDSTEQEACAVNYSTAAKFFKVVYIYSAQRFFGTLAIAFDQIVADVQREVGTSNRSYHFFGSLIVDQSLECVVKFINGKE